MTSWLWRGPTTISGIPVRGPYNKLSLEDAPFGRAAARASGATAYRSDKPCPKGHVGLRTTANGSCIVCSREVNRRRENWRRTDPATKKEHRRRWSASQKGREAKDRWIAAHPVSAWVARILPSARTRAKKKGIAFDLDREYLLSIAHEICPVFGERLVYLPSWEHKRTPQYSASLDRIDPALGYVRGNVAVISYKANLIKSVANAQEIRQVADWLQALNQRMTA